MTPVWPRHEGFARVLADTTRRGKTVRHKKNFATSTRDVCANSAVGLSACDGNFPV